MLKSFINEAHSRGIAVIFDIALNHSFGQNPMVRMYFDPAAGQYGQPTANSPWFNETPKHDFNVGYDFNHESQATRNFCKRVFGYWLTEYHVGKHCCLERLRPIACQHFDRLLQSHANA
jgi:1,4-alpha-glucan branching enzyme